MVDRRRFVVAATATLATLAGFARAARAASIEPPAALGWWRNHLEEQAELQGDNWHLVEIGEVHDHGTRILEQYTIVFRGAPGDPVTESIYDVNVAGASTRLLIQPAGEDDLASYSRATISRFRPWLMRLLLKRRAQLKTAS